jgi:phosphate/sulfate permease
MHSSSAVVSVCPKCPTSQFTPSPTPNAVILSEAKNPRIDYAFLFFAFSAQKSHVKTSKPPNFQIITEKYTNKETYKRRINYWFSLFVVILSAAKNPRICVCSRRH